MMVARLLVVESGVKRIVVVVVVEVVLGDVPEQRAVVVLGGTLVVNLCRRLQQ
jgi:hypothetical protein